MAMILAQVEGETGGSALASWAPVNGLLLAFAAVVVALIVAGRPGDHPSAVARHALRAPNALERLTGIPGWAAAAVGTSLFGLLLAGQGFYSDVAWHVGLGRDELLFTAPHTAIAVGLLLIAGGAFLGILLATLGRVPVGRSFAGLTVPWSTIPLGALGVAAVLGFPIDDLWHGEYGVDVTMWSPPHMMMILGASFTGLAAWLVLAEAGVPVRGGWGRGVHVVAGWLTLQGLAASQGEFAFGVPQFQQLFHPVLVTLAAGFALVTIRLVHGPFWAVGIAAASLLIEALDLLGGETGPVDTRVGGIYVVSALAIEAVAAIWGTRQRLRFGLLSGAAVGTVGLAGEWLWNQRAYQPWNSSLLPEAVILAVVVGTGAAVLAAGFAATLRGDGADRRVPVPALGLAGLAVLAAVLIPMPRDVGDVSAELTVEPAGGGEVTVEAVLDPPDAAEDARWFQVTSWQGGGLALADMERVEPGRYRTSEPVPASGSWKTLLRLHRDGEMMVVPVYLPEDEEIGEPEIPAEDRSQAFERETIYLLRETTDGNTWMRAVVYALFFLAILVWAATHVLAAARIASRPRELAGTRA